MEQTVTLPARDLVEAFRFALSAAAVQDVRYYLRSVLLETWSGRLYFVGTDGHRMALVETLEIPGLVDGQWVLGRDAVANLVKIRKPKAGQVDTLVLADAGAHVIVGNAILPLDIVPDARFPDWSRVVPNELLSGNLRPDTIIGANAGYLADAAKACERLANAKYHGVKVRPGLADPQTGRGGVVFEPGICPSFDMLGRAWVYVLPMRL